ncbi:class I SAM-dependent methyltransferase [Paenibacillus solisilvae]|uniref:Class I SAM-dependent methyltransferase n=1 Tax=Paenibacillus solisilvae TaxID=2486751 RepID=A0ABW0VSP9_9BACL
MSEYLSAGTSGLPEELFDDLIHATNLNPGDRLLEVDCATGKATLPFTKRGFNITCVELGAELAAVARQNLVGMDADI